MRCFLVSTVTALLLFPAVAWRAGKGTADAFQRKSSADSAGSGTASVVKTRAYVSLEPVPRGRSFEVAVVAEILSGYHVNSNKPLDEFLIPTTLSEELPHGLKEVEVVYPQGHLLKFSFSPVKPLSVYSGSVSLRMHLEAALDAPLGAQTIPLTLRYQACNDSTCLPPVKVPIAAKIQIAPAGTRARALHTEIFATPKPASLK